MPDPSWFEHVDLMQALIVGLAGIIAFFMIRALNSITRNQTDLYNKHNNHETRLAHLEGEHTARSTIYPKC